MRAGRTDDASPSRIRRRWSFAAATALVAMVTIFPAAGALASTGSIPPDVSQFAQADDGLVLELEEYFGVDQRGAGLDFSEGIELGEIDRIFLWSEAYHAGKTTETPVQYVNRWKVPVLMGEEPIGIAMIGIDPATVEPEMIDFIRSPGTALALDDIDKDATLVHESETGAWFSLSEDVIIPLVRGDSGVSEEITLVRYQKMLSNREVEIVESVPQPDQGSVQSVVLIATTAGVLLLALLIPTILGKVRERRERLADAETDAEADAEISAGSDGETAAAIVADSDGDAATVDTTLRAPDSETTSPNNAGDKAEAEIVAPAMTATSTTTRADNSTKSTTKTATSKVAPATKKPATTTSAAKKPAAKKPVAKKPAAKKPTAATTTSTASAATKTSPAKIATAKKTAAKTATAKTSPAKPAAAKTTPKKPAAAKPATTKPATTKSASAKPASSKPAAKKPAVKKPAAAKKPAAPKPTAD